MPEEINDYISLQEATQYCHYSQSYLKLRVRQGKLRAIKIGRNWATKKEWIEEYLKKIEEYNNKKAEIGSPLFGSPQTRERVPVFRFGFVFGLVFVLLVTGIVFGKESFTPIKDFVVDVAEEASAIVFNGTENASQSVLAFAGTAQLAIINPEVIPEITPEITKKELEALQAKFEALKQEFEKFKKEPKVTQRIEPIKEIIREIEKVKKINEIDDRALIKLKAQILAIQKWETDIKDLRAITAKLQAHPVGIAVPTAPIYIDTPGIRVGGHGIFLSLGVSGLASIGQGLGVGGSTVLGSTSSDRLTVNAASYFKAPVIFDSNVGIGTTTPETKLDIVGTARMTGFQLGTTATPGYVLTADDFGVGTWQPITFPDPPENGLPADIAEWFKFTGERPIAGEVVSIGEEPITVEKSTKAYDEKLVGVISTEPYLAIGPETDDSVMVALIGRVPVKVSLENGPIEIGDALTSSSQPGVAMKATASGRVIGLALESLSEIDFENCNIENSLKIENCELEIGRITVFVNSHWRGVLAEDGSLVAFGDSLAATTEQGEMVSDTIFDSISQEINQTLASLGLFIEDGIARVRELFAERVVTKQICLEGDDGGIICVDKNQLEELLILLRIQTLLSTPASESTSELAPESKPEISTTADSTTTTQD